MLEEKPMEEMLDPSFREGYRKGYKDALQEVAKRLETRNVDYLEGLNYDLQTNNKSCLTSTQT